MDFTIPILCLAVCGISLGQQAGSLTTESHPSLTTYECTAAGSCSTVSSSVTMDANWRWLHSTSSSTNCYSGNTWSTTYCTDEDTCATNCALDGCDYSGTYGVSTSGTALTLKLVTVGAYSTNVGSRLYLMASESKYKMFQLLNREFAFDVDVSNLPCGLNGALYFVEMDETGNMGVGNNKAGAKFGTGYCDGQCPHDVKFINGQANLVDWTPTTTNSGKGKYGSCCGEMDIWEANKMSAAYTPHNCKKSGLYRCSSATECGDSGHRYDGICDKDGCDFNSYRMGNTTFYGESKTIDTTKVFTVVTQFLTSDGTDDTDLVEIKRFYKQGGVVYPNSYSTFSSLSSYNSVNDNMCAATKELFGDENDFKNKGGMKAHGELISRGMVLVLSLWDDTDAYMLWLDSNYPTTKSNSTPGVSRGSCSTSSGVPSSVESTYPNAYVIFSNIKFGPLGTTTSGVNATKSTYSGDTGCATSVVSSFFAMLLLAFFLF